MSARARGCSVAIVNSAASAHLCTFLAGQGITSTLLVHELPRLIREKGLLAPLREGVAAASKVVFAAAFVREQCEALVTLDPSQGRRFCRRASINRPCRMRSRALRSGPSCGCPPGAILAVGMGYADLRKGFDLFLQVWRATCGTAPSVHFAWVGNMDSAMETYLGGEIAAAEATGNFRHLGHREDTAAVLAAADVFLLTSREDPLPSVALEAMSAGVPVVAFEETGGIPGLLAEIGGGESVPLGDVAAMARALVRLAAALAQTGLRSWPRQARPPSRSTAIARVCWRWRNQGCCRSPSWCPATITAATWRAAGLDLRAKLPGARGDRARRRVDRPQPRHCRGDGRRLVPANPHRAQTSTIRARSLPSGGVRQNRRPASGSGLPRPMICPISPFMTRWPWRSAVQTIRFWRSATVAPSTAKVRFCRPITKPIMRGRRGSARSGRGVRRPGPSCEPAWPSGI